MASTSSSNVRTGLTLVGYSERHPWLWLVDVDAAAIGPANTSLPGNSDAVSAICTRRDWLAVETHTAVWSAPLGLNGPGRRLRQSYTFVPSSDPRAIWVDAGPHSRRSLEAVDGRGQVLDSLELPQGWRLHAEAPHGFTIENVDDRLIATFIGRQVEVLLRDVQALGARRGALIAWTRRDDAVLGVTDLAAGTHEIHHPDIAEWQQFASFSPDGRYLAIGGYPDPPRRRTPSLSDAPSQPYKGRRAVMALVETASGHCELMRGEFDNFAWTPTWSADASWVVFGAPFQRRRLYAFQPEEGVLHALTFKRQPPMPMIDVTGIVTVPAST